MPIRAVCFDLDNTLWDVWPVIHRAERAMYEFLASRYPKVTAALTVEMMREARMRTAAEHPQMQHDFSFLRLQTLRDHASEFGYAEHMAEEAFEVFSQARNQVELYDDVLPALERLRGAYRLFTATNGNADLTQIGLAHYFERRIAARQVGALKPDPIIFQKVVVGSDLALEEVAFVGDDPVMDVAGSTAAGMLGIWLNRDGSPWPEHLEPPGATITSLDEIGALLRREA